MKQAPSKDTFVLHQFGLSYTCYITTDKYHSTKALAVQLVSWDEDMGMWVPHATISINCDKEVMLSLGLEEFVFKDYSENEGLLQQMTELGIVEDTGRTVDLPYATCQCVRLTSKARDYIAP